VCGIFGYAGKREALSITLSGLKKLEYRGYDSAGIASIKDGQLFYCKEVGKIKNLSDKLQFNSNDFSLAISHTRWATHGKPTLANAHPQFDQKMSLALVHNGIIENYDSLRKLLQEQGVVFNSQTDTEVVAQLIGNFYEGNLLIAIQKSINLLKGSYAIALIHKDYPDTIFAFANHSPLSIGIGHEGKNETFISSDPQAFEKHSKQVIYLSNNEIAVITSKSVEVYDSNLQKISHQIHLVESNTEEINKGDYPHFTLKEIFEQPKTVSKALEGRFIEEYGVANFEELQPFYNQISSIERILILACGTSWHAGYVGAYLFEEIARVQVQNEISSEFRYKNPVVPSGTFVIAISQSGETADTIAAMRELKAKGAFVLALCNVAGSTLAREADSCVLLKAGPEIGVCSTKAFSNQVVVLSLFALALARRNNFSKLDGRAFIEELKKIPSQIGAVLNQEDKIKDIAHKYAHYNNFFFIGRSYLYPTSLEGALKLKEISYINASGYPAGEMKHGPIALINEDCPTIALCANKLTKDKLVGNIMEIKSRNGKVIAIAEEDQTELESIVDDIIYIPKVIDQLAAIPSSIVSQLFAYHVAKIRGTDIDQPRNLAKSVTVE